MTTMWILFGIAYILTCILNYILFKWCHVLDNKCQNLEHNWDYPLYSKYDRQTSLMLMWWSVLSTIVAIILLCCKVVALRRTLKGDTTIRRIKTRARW